MDVPVCDGKFDGTELINSVGVVLGWGESDGSTDGFSEMSIADGTAESIAVGSAEGCVDGTAESVSVGTGVV